MPSNEHLAEVAPMPGTNGVFTMAVFHGSDVPSGTKLYREPPAAGRLSEDDVEWVVNDIAELGIKIGDQFFFCYKGESLVYKDGKHDDDTPIMWRRVLKREFGECVHPINYDDPTRVGTVSVEDGNEWRAIPATGAEA